MNDKSIKYINCGVSCSIIYKHNGELWYFGHNLNWHFEDGGVNKPTLLFRDSSLKILMDKKN